MQRKRGIEKKTRSKSKSTKFKDPKLICPQNNCMYQHFSLSLSTINKLLIFDHQKKQHATADLGMHIFFRQIGREVERDRRRNKMEKMTAAALSNHYILRPGAAWSKRKKKGQSCNCSALNYSNPALVYSKLYIKFFFKRC